MRNELRQRRVAQWWPLIGALGFGLTACGDETPAPTSATTIHPGSTPKRWHEFRTHKFDEGLDAEQRRQIERLESIGYLSGSVEPGVDRGVTVLTDQADAGLNFYTSGHGPEALLMDMEGNVLHRWHYDFWKVWPDYPVNRDHVATQYWRRAYLYGNGDVLAIYEGLGLIKLDRSSNLLWAYSGRAHHDLHVMPDGRIYVLTREARMDPTVHPTKPIVEDFVSILDSNGKEIERVSLLRCIKNSGMTISWPSGEMPHGDFVHTNSIEVLDGQFADRIPAFREGNVLVAFLMLSVNAVIDLDQQKVVWFDDGDFVNHHDPRLLDNRHMIFFDNKGRPGKSSIQEIDPLTGRVLWAYRGTDSQPFYSETCGAVQRLPNGNTVITESDRGRAFEVTPGHQIVWEFHNPHRSGPQGRYIATLFEVVRLPVHFPLDWRD